MKIKEYLESKKQCRKLKRTIVGVNIGEAIYRDKLENYSIVSMTDKKTGMPEFRLCTEEAEFTQFIPFIFSVGNSTTINYQPQYRNYYVDLFDSRKPLNDKEYNIGEAYYLTYLFSIDYLEGKNYCLTREEIEQVFEQKRKEVMEKKYSK